MDDDVTTEQFRNILKNHGYYSSDESDVSDSDSNQDSESIFEENTPCPLFIDPSTVNIIEIGVPKKKKAVLRNHPPQNEIGGLTKSQRKRRRGRRRRRAKNKNEDAPLRPVISDHPCVCDDGPLFFTDEKIAALERRKTSIVFIQDNLVEDVQNDQLDSIISASDNTQDNYFKPDHCFQDFGSRVVPEAKTDEKNVEVATAHLPFSGENVEDGQKKKTKKTEVFNYLGLSGQESAVEDNQNKCDNYTQGKNLSPVENLDKVIGENKKKKRRRKKTIPNDTNVPSRHEREISEENGEREIPNAVEYPVDESTGAIKKKNKRRRKKGKKLLETNELEHFSSIEKPTGERKKTDNINKNQSDKTYTGNPTVDSNGSAQILNYIDDINAFLKMKSGLGVTNAFKLLGDVFKNNFSAFAIMTEILMVESKFQKLGIPLFNCYRCVSDVIIKLAFSFENFTTYKEKMRMDNREFLFHMDTIILDVLDCPSYKSDFRFLNNDLFHNVYRLFNISLVSLAEKIVDAIDTKKENFEFLCNDMVSPEYICQNQSISYLERVARVIRKKRNVPKYSVEKFKSRRYMFLLLQIPPSMRNREEFKAQNLNGDPWFPQYVLEYQDKATSTSDLTQIDEISDASGQNFTEGRNFESDLDFSKKKESKDENRTAKYIQSGQKFSQI